MTTTRDFHLSDILCITDGRLVSSRGMDGIYDILSFMTGEQLFTHQLPRAMRSCQPALLAQHPQLAATVEPESKLDPGTVPAWVAKQVAKFGETLPVTSLAEWQSKNPIQELAEMLPNTPIAVAVVGDDA
jgi:hypothetical protein